MMREVMEAGGTRISEVNFSEVTEGDIKTWLAYGALMAKQSPLAPFQMARAALSSAPEHIILRLFVARCPDGHVAAEGRAVMTREMNPARSCHVYVSVRPDQRRRGIAGAMLKLLVEAAECMDRSMLVGWTTDRDAAGTEFAKHLGAHCLQELLTSRLLRQEIDEHMVQQWITEASSRAHNYRLIKIDGQFPEEMTAEIFSLRSLAQNTPEEALVREIPVTTIDEMRSTQSLGPATRQRKALVAIQESNGRIAGFTDVFFQKEDSRIVSQGGTIVHPEHRWHGIGKWLKGAMLKQLLEEIPELEEIHTSNALSNKIILHMNDAMGFKPWTIATAWQISTSSLRKTICSMEEVCK